VALDGLGTTPGKVGNRVHGGKAASSVLVRELFERDQDHLPRHAHARPHDPGAPARKEGPLLRRLPAWHGDAHRVFVRSAARASQYASTSEASQALVRGLSFAGFGNAPA
jgi:hypothetical protein